MIEPVESSRSESAAHGRRCRIQDNGDSYVGVEIFAQPENRLILRAARR
jgi:hypothetical protein